MTDLSGMVGNSKKRCCLWVGAMLLALMLPACGAAHTDAKAGSAEPSQAVQSLPATPGEVDVENLLGKVTMTLPDDDGYSRVSGRILDGFEAAASPLRLDSGDVIYWGFKYQEGSAESVAIYDAQHHLRLVAAVDGITRLTVLGKPHLESVADYQQAVHESGVEPSVFVFVRDEADLKQYLPLFDRWLQADLLGFNMDCTQAGMARVCALATQIRIPVHAYAVENGGGKVRQLVVPVVKPSTTPIKLFEQ
jgi:hypothetical protein